MKKDYTFDFKGHTALITGAASGLGCAMSRALAASGADIVLFDLNETGANALANELEAKHRIRALSFGGSVTDPKQVEQACGMAVEATGRLDIVLNNAGVSANAPSLDLNLALWQTVIDVNLTGVFLLAQAAARIMAQKGGGTIINTASMYGVAAAPARAAYCSTKAAVVALTKVLAIEWAALGIRVNALGPGYVKTALTLKLASEGRIDLDALAERTPMGRLGTPEEIAAMALFLASDAASYITGQTLVGDGGWTSYSYI